MLAGSDRRYQVVIWGATGVVGRCACTTMIKYYQDEVKWAMAGRNEEKLEAIRNDLAKEYPAARNTPILTGDAEDRDSLVAIASQTKVLISTSGPFAKLGTLVVEACITAGTHYCDITGEVPWVMRIIKTYHAEAACKGVKIVNFCGFDSIPSDLGTTFIVNHMQERLHRRCKKVTHLFGDAAGLTGQGSIASLAAAYFMENSAERRQSSDPYCLDPPDSRRGPDRADTLRIYFDRTLNKWTIPFIMSPINTRVVRRSNALLHHSYGSNFSFEEVAQVPNVLVAGIALVVLTISCALFLCKPLYPLINWVLPRVGADPEKIVQGGGYWNSTFVGETEEQSGHKSQLVLLKMKSRRDPGYWETSRLVVESALCLALQEDELKNSGLKQGGVLTPASAMGMTLVRRLQKAGTSFELQ